MEAYAGYARCASDEELCQLAAIYQASIYVNLDELGEHNQSGNKVEYERTITRMQENRWRLDITRAALAERGLRLLM